MFTGIIKKVVTVEKTERKNGSLFLTFKKPKNFKIALGNSIATDGVCLTVAKINKTSYTCELMAETLEKTCFGKFVPRFVNLEPSLKMDGELGGHFVLGHVDCIGKVKSIIKKSSGVLCTIEFPKKFSKIVVSKGSIAIDGVSLTVIETGLNWFSVSLVTYTLGNTILSYKKVGSLVNLEFDIIGKYVINNLKHSK